MVADRDGSSTSCVAARRSHGNRAQRWLHAPDADRKAYGKIEEQRYFRRRPSEKNGLALARKAKANAYPHKDSEGRRINPSPCLPFILTSMGGLCSEGHEFLRLCRSRDQAEADHMVDVLVTQHSRWTFTEHSSVSHS